MSTSVHVNLFTHTVTFVTDKMMSSLRRIIVWSGLDPSSLLANWNDLELGIKTWLGSRDLTEVTLEVFVSSSGGLVGRWDFDIDYGFGGADEGDMWVDTDAIRFAIRKQGLNPAGCSYRIILTTKKDRPDVAGWESATLVSTAGFTRYSIGTTIGTSGLGTRTAYWRKN